LTNRDENPALLRSGTGAQVNDTRPNVPFGTDGQQVLSRITKVGNTIKILNSQDQFPMIAANWTLRLSIEHLLRSLR
jgi:hypothetical protein